jgi:hypothetical protein
MQVEFGMDGCDEGMGGSAPGTALSDALASLRAQEQLILDEGLRQVGRHARPLGPVLLQVRTSALSDES